MSLSTASLRICRLLTLTSVTVFISLLYRHFNKISLELKAHSSRGDCLALSMYLFHWEGSVFPRPDQDCGQ